MMFDGAILSWVFNITPKVYFDTLCIARALHGTNAGGSLKALAERYNLGQKGTTVLQAKGKRLEDFQPHELHEYGEYCKNDTELTYSLFNIIIKGFSPSELKLIDLTIRMFTQPQIHVDDALLIQRLEEVKDEKEKLLLGLKSKLNCDSEEEVRKKLASNKQFAELLCQLKVKVPMKESPTTGKQTFALAKTDEGFINLQQHEDSFIQDLCAVRLGTKSTIEESRIERFIGIGSRNKGLLPIPLKYYGAHTGRWSGSDKVNFQNLPSRDVKKKALKQALIPPDDSVILNVDSSQIEARVLVWLAGQEDVTQWFREGRDVYLEFASKVYDRKLTKTDKIERFVGKTCILGLGYGTGAMKLQNVLKLGGAELSETECQRLVNLYRELNDKVVELWRDCDGALSDIASWPKDKPEYYIGQKKVVSVTPEGLKLPNGLYIYYPELEWDTSELKGGYVYNSRRGKIGTWGGSVVENIVQALARIIIGEQMVAISHKYRPVLTVHDAIVCVAGEEEKDEALNYIMGEMSKPPGWAKDCPITCEGGYAKNYGDC
jgi:DNA polymerase